MIDKYLEKEVGDHREITSSMVVRAQRKRDNDINRNSFFYSAPTVAAMDQQRAMAQSQMLQQGSYGLANQLGGALGGLVGAPSLARCPYCGR